MARDTTTQTDHFARALTGLNQLRQFSGAPKQFWQTLLESMALLANARLAVLLHRPSNEADQWRRVGVWPADPAVGSSAHQFLRELDDLANACLDQDAAVRFFDAARGVVANQCALAIRLETEAAPEAWVAAFHLPEATDAQAASALRQLRLVSHLPAAYQSQRNAAQAQVQLSHFASVLDLMALLNAQQRYMAVAMTLCNELAARHKCDRVSLGWLEGEYARIQAISHTEKFEKKMEAVRALEQTLEEALDQDEIIVWPPPENDTRISRDHEHYARNQNVKHVCSVPLRLAGAPVGAVLCERGSEAFSEDEQRLLGLSTEIAARRLGDLKRSDRWFGARWALAARENLAKLVGVEHTWAKVIAVLAAVGLAVLFFGRMNYRVEAPFIVRTENLALLTAPFNGFIEDVPVRVGDVLNPGEPLLKLDTRELLLEEAAASADLERFTREAEKARANIQLAEMRIAQAQADQSRARLNLVRFRLNQAGITAPFACVVVEGDLKKRLGAPVKQGDPLFKVARLDRMYVECNVKEADIHEVRGDATGEIAFASQPKLKFPMRLERIEPASQTKDKDNVFVVRCQFQDAPQDWWRPGMSGVAKINVGPRTFFWILSHRTIDFLRMFFWM